MSDTRTTSSDTVEHSPRILFCNCTYARVVPVEVKRSVLAALSDAGLAFDAVPDLCDMAARKDPALKRLGDGSQVRIAACYERAVRWLFHAARNPLPEEGVEILNMREESAETIVRALLAPPCTGCGKIEP